MNNPYRDLDFDLDELVELFGDPLSHSKAELKQYWLRYERKDGVSISLTLDGYERDVSISVGRFTQTYSSMTTTACDFVRVLESSRKTLEIVATLPRNIRTFIALDGDPIVDTSMGD